MKIKRAIISLLMLTSFLTLSSCGLISNFFGPDEDEEETTSGNPLIKTSTTTTSTDGDTTTTSVNTTTSTTTTIAQTYTLTFNPNGGSGSPIVINNKHKNEVVTLPMCTYVNSGYTFHGWYDGEQTYGAYDNYTVKGDVTFNAVWINEDSYTVTYVTGNGKNSLSNPSIYETLDNVELVDAEVPEGFNYEFAGWYTSLDFEEENKITNLYGHNGNLTLYAAYTKPLYWSDIVGTKQSDKTVVNVEYSEGVISRILNYGLFYNTQKLEVTLTNVPANIYSRINELMSSIETEVHKNYYSTSFQTQTLPGSVKLTITYNFGANGQENTVLVDNNSKQGNFINFVNKDGDHGIYNYLLSTQTLENLETSDQLYYALEKGYNFTITPGSLAEEVYTEATNILDDIIDKNMSEKDKVVAIASYLMKNVNYDHVLSETTGTAANANTYQYRGHFASGALLDGCAVCDGYAKAFTILCGLEGIKSKVSRGYLGDTDGGHAWNKVFIDADSNGTKEWYAVDVTNSEVGIGINGNTVECSNYSRILITDYDLINLNYSYRGNDLINSETSSMTNEEKWALGRDLNNIKDLADTFYDLYEDTEFTYNVAFIEHSYNFVVNSQSDLNTIVNQNESLIRSSNIFILSIETSESLTLSLNVSGYTKYTSHQLIHKADGTDIYIKLFILIKN
jgi:uncharacterized repeat protein (TIGR02543 family)